MAPPKSAACPLRRVRLRKVREMAPARLYWLRKWRVAPRASRVICCPVPSTVVVRAMVFVVVIGMVTAPPPQSKVTVPPPLKAWLRAASVQLAALPLPTTPDARSEAGGRASDKVATNKARMTGLPGERTRSVDQMGLPAQATHVTTSPRSCAAT